MIIQTRQKGWHWGSGEGHNWGRAQLKKGTIGGGAQLGKGTTEAERSPNQIIINEKSNYIMIFCKGTFF